MRNRIVFHFPVSPLSYGGYRWDHVPFKRSYYGLENRFGFAVGGWATTLLNEELDRASRVHYNDLKKRKEAADREAARLPNRLRKLFGL